MSTPSITLTGAQSEYMYKKTLGVAYEYPGTQPSTESVSSLPYVFNNNIIPYNIPIPAPALDVSSGISGGGTKWTTDVSFIFYYENLPLSINPDTQKYSFVYSSTQSSNVTTHSIPSTYDSLGGTYAISVYDSNNTPVLDTTYIFDNATGCLTFINGPFNPTYSGNPSISFYRYEGPFGVDGGSSQWSTNGNNIYYNTGYVGIGRSTPTRPLDVSGNILITGSNAIFNTQVGIDRTPQSTYVLDVKGDTRITSGSLSVNKGLITGHSLDVSGISRFEGPLGINKNPSFTYVLDVSGDVFITGSKAVFYAPVGINIVPVSPYSLDVSGNVYISGDLTSLSSTTTSDYRMKTDIRIIDDKFTIDDLKPVIYKLKNNNQVQTGFIAHELQEYYPFLVNGEKDGKNMQSINYSGLIPILVREIQELKRQINILKNK